MVKRGRPKGSKNKPKLLIETPQPPKKRGRPKGSKNKVKVLSFKEAPLKSHKRGRPKGSKNKATILKERQDRLNHKEVEPPKPPPPSHKLLGHCKCGAMICSMDLLTKFIYSCPQCKVRARIKTLVKKLRTESYTSEKDWREHSTNSDHIASVPLSDEIDPKDVRVKE